MSIRKKKVLNFAELKRFAKPGEEEGGSTPAQNSVGTEQIKNGSIQEEDLHPDLQAGLHELDNEENYATDEMVARLFNDNQ